jgi:hypothetical protein
VPDTTHDIRFRLFDTLLARFQPGRLVDLGTGHGAFALRAASAGWQAVGIDARTDRLPDDPRVEWRIDDVRTCDVSGFDLIVNLGLQYHLDIETQLSLLGRCSGTPMILDTHFGNPEETAFNLGPTIEQHGYKGRLYSEADIQHDPRSSMGNLSSFWPESGELVRMLGDFDYDVFTAEPYYLRSRTFYLCLPRS